MHGTEAEIAEAASWFLDRRPALDRDDCSGLVEAVLARAGVDERGSVATMWDDAVAAGRTHRSHRPRAGDLAFFDDTYDRDEDGVPDDVLSHVAVVVSVTADGTITMVHRSSSQGIATLRMNLDRPDVHADGGLVLNDWLAKLGWDPPEGRLAGELWHGFASLGADVAPGPPPDDVPKVADGGRWRLPTLPEGDVRWRTVLKGLPLLPWAANGLSCDDVWSLHAAIYARHGYAFEVPEVQALFSTTGWYQPTTDREDVLTAIDRYNLRVLSRRECGS